MNARCVRWCAAGALVALAGMAGAAPAPTGTAALDTRVVRDAAGRFEISIPASWEVRVFPPGSGGVALIARAHAAPGEFVTNVVVTAEALPAGMTSAGYGQASAAMLRNTLRAFRALSEGPARAGGGPGYTRTYTWLTGNGTPVYAIQAYLAREGVGFVATGSTRNDPASIARDASMLRRLVLSLRALGSVAARGGEPMPGATAALGARRDLFAPPPGATPALGRGSPALPSVPSAGAVPLPPLPPATPLPPPALGSGTSPPSPPAPPPPRLAAVVLGPVPQAVLRGADGTYAIVHRGEHTSWGTIEAIRASGVVLATPSGTHTIVWSAGGSQ
jgi:hypothetical protein